MRRVLLLLVAMVGVVALHAAERERVNGISYRADDDYSNKMCRVDVSYEKGAQNRPVIVWFHGGGLEKGNKDLLDGFRRQGFAVVSVNYRLFPQCKCPDYIDDSAMAVAWTFENIEKYGGNKDQIYVSGHSAGGYLTLMVTLAKEYMEKYGADADKIAKAYPVSGQTVTH